MHVLSKRYFTIVWAMVVLGNILYLRYCLEKKNLTRTMNLVLIKIFCLGITCHDLCYPLYLQLLVLYAWYSPHTSALWLLYLSLWGVVEEGTERLWALEDRGICCEILSLCVTKKLQIWALTNIVAWAGSTEQSHQLTCLYGWRKYNISHLDERATHRWSMLTERRGEINFL